MGSLGQVVELANGGPIVEVEVEWFLLLSCMETERYFSWDRLDALSIVKANVLND
jgi:hypothetical protein